MKKSNYLIGLSLLASASLFALPSTTLAGLCDNAAARLYRLLQESNDPWFRAVQQRNFSIAPGLPVVDNTVVVPLWKLQNTNNPIATLKNSLDSLKDAGVTNIYFPSWCEQTLYEFYGSPNIHGYWSKNFNMRSVDPKLGTFKELAEVIKIAKAKGFNFTLDINIRQLGYPPKDGKITLWGREVDAKDGRYFIQSRDPVGADYQNFEYNIGPAMMEEFTRLKMWGLPLLNFDNPWIQENLIKDHLVAIDLGITNFRVDAAKHQPASHIAKITQAMSAYAAKRGLQPRFYLEYLSHNYSEIAYKLSEMGNVKNIFFLDIRMSSAIRSSIMGNDGFTSIETALLDQEINKLDNRLFIQQITDQDAFFPPMYHGDYKSEGETVATVLTSHMTSSNRPYYVAGLEQSVPHGTERNMPAVVVDKKSPIYNSLSYINHYMNENFKNLEPVTSQNVIKANGYELVMERKFKNSNKKLILILDKSGQSGSVEYWKNALGAKKSIFEWGRGGPLEIFMAETGS